MNHGKDMIYYNRTVFRTLENCDVKEKKQHGCFCPPIIHIILAISMAQRCDI